MGNIGFDDAADNRFDLTLKAHMPSDFSRRLLLASIGTLLPKSVIARPGAWHGGYGHGRDSSRPLLSAAGGRMPLTISLAFADGKSLSFHEAAAENIGDYVGPFVHQKCLRQRAAGNNDYHDGFVVFFRPDANGSRDEVVIEYGTELDFSNGPPKPARGTTPMNLFVPSSPNLTKTSGGASSQSRSVYVYLSYVTPTGESVACYPAGISLGRR